MTASPNPGTSYFQITLKGGNHNQQVGYKAYNVLSGLIEQKQGLQPGTTFRIGQNYKTGLYLVEFTQGLDKEVLLLLKLR